MSFDTEEASLSEPPRKVQIPSAILMSQKAWSLIREETLRAGKKETGGVLVGCRVTYDSKPFLVVVAASGAGSKADRQLYTYAPEVEALQQALDQVCQDYLQKGVRVDYIGEWHKHPKGMTYLSREDIKQGQTILTDPDYNLEYGEIILPIATLAGKNSLSFGWLFGQSDGQPDGQESPPNGKGKDVVELHTYYLSQLHPEALELELMIWEEGALDNLLAEVSLLQSS